MSGALFDPAGEPADEMALWVDALRLVWCAVRDTGELGDFGADVSEVVTVTVLGGGVHLTRSFAETACCWVWSPEETRVHAREAVGRADVTLAIALEHAAALAEESMR